MAIKFYCVNCNRMLRVRDESAGKKSRCPDCGTVLEVPLHSDALAETDFEVESPIESSNPFLAADRPGQRSDTAYNPYQSPETDDSGINSRQAVGSGDIVPTTMDLGSVLNLAWEIFKSRMGLIVGAVLLVGVLGQIVGYIAALVNSIALQEMGNAGYVVVGLMQLGSYVFSTFLNIGQLKLMLNIARGRTAEIGDVFSGGPFFRSAVLASLLFTLMAMGGFILLIVPGIIVTLMFSQYLFLIVDKNAGVKESLMLSKQVTDGNKMTLFLMGIVSTGIMFLGLLACGVGIIFSAGYLATILVVAYLTMTGQPIARP